MTTTIEKPESKALPEAVARRGIDTAQWNTLCRSLYPGANPNSVLLVVDYCRARKLDPLKKPCHIVPMEVRDAKTGEKAWRDVVMPGIYELRTTAQRTGQYLGHSKPEYGPLAEALGVTAPEWCDITVYRWNVVAAQRIEFPVRVFFREAVAVSKDYKTGALKANQRWSKAPIQMLTKCAEAAALREAFPDEIGGEQTAEEMDGQRAVDATLEPDTAKVLPAKPDGYDDWLGALTDAANDGTAVLMGMWRESPEACRTFLTATALDQWERLRVMAADAEAEAGQ